MLNLTDQRNLRAKRYEMLRKDTNNQTGIDFIKVIWRNRTLSQLYIYLIPKLKNLPPLKEIKSENIRIFRQSDRAPVGIKIDKIIYDESNKSPKLILELNQESQLSEELKKCSLFLLDIVNVRTVDPFFAEAEFYTAHSSGFDETTDSAQISATSDINPEIDYLTRDYTGFRRLLIDRLALLMPHWQGDHPADLMTVLIEVLAYAADQLSYYQDAVATEAYLRTARQRISVKRHVRLIDYELHEGCNARVWVRLEVKQTVNLPLGTPVLTALPAYKDKLYLNQEEYNQEISQGNSVEVFETLYPVTLLANHNKILPYAWGATDYYLEPGSTKAFLEGKYPLKPGDIVLLEGPNQVDKDAIDHHVVRLKKVDSEIIDHLFTKQLTCIEWYPEDALPFPLKITDALGNTTAQACANLVLADHGRRIDHEPLIPATVPTEATYRPYLKRQNITFHTSFDLKQYQNCAACFVTQQNPAQALPDVKLTMQLKPSNASASWEARATLLQSHRFAQHFVLEVEENRRAYVRFGQGGLGMAPLPHAVFTANYRIGNGTRGNIGRGALAHIVTEEEGIIAITNPLPAEGGIEPEPIEQAKRLAPYAFYRQQRGVTLEDCCRLLQQHPMVKNAAAHQDWNGTWPVIKIAVIRQGYLPFDSTIQTILEAYMADFRLLADEIKIVPPVYVPLDIKLVIHIKKGYNKDQVTQDLYQMFSTGFLKDGTRGFFHPDHFSFGQPIYFSSLMTHALKVPGVVSVEPAKGSFRRLSDPQPSSDKKLPNRITTGSLEIICVRNDTSNPDWGRIQFELKTEA